MIKYLLLDTCTIIHLIKGNETGKEILKWINDLPNKPIQVISVVSKVELIAFSKIKKWGNFRLENLNEFLKGILVLDINNIDNNLLNNYILIDLYNKNTLPDSDGNYIVGSHKTMGKNDIWIGATAITIKATLLTCDNDFDHLPKSMINLKKFKYNNKTKNN